MEKIIIINCKTNQFHHLIRYFKWNIPLEAQFSNIRSLIIVTNVTAKFVYSLFLINSQLSTPMVVNPAVLSIVTAADLAEIYSTRR